MHRDLKPENIIFRSKDNDTDIVVIDFGLAMEENQPVVMKRCGTPGFIAPEIINFRKGLPFYDKKCDVYSLGIIFYILLVTRCLYKIRLEKIHS
jgi:serine/threonine protein kinase